MFQVSFKYQTILCKCVIVMYKMTYSNARNNSCCGARVFVNDSRVDAKTMSKQ